MKLRHEQGVVRTVSRWNGVVKRGRRKNKCSSNV